LKKFRLVIGSTLGVLLGIVLYCAPAHAQATRTFVSGTGDDANPCSRTAPCKTFAGAISKTATSGEIDCLDPGGFGALTITKSITVDCTGTFGSVLVGGTNGIVVNSGSPLNVALRGLAFDGTGTGLNGIRLLAPGTVLLEKVRVFGFTTNGIDIEPGTGALAVDIVDSTVSINTAGGILVKPAAAATAQVSLTRVNMHSGTFGLRAEDGSKVTVFGSVASNNTKNGFLAVSTSSPVDIHLANSVAANNGTNGISTSGTGATITISNTSIFDNATGINTSAGGTVSAFSPATNVNAGNTTPGSPNGTPAGLQ
jgi:Right handed beta helix region